MSEKIPSRIEKPKETSNLQSLELKANLNPEQKGYLEKLKARAGIILGKKTEAEFLAVVKDVKILSGYKETLGQILHFLKTKEMRKIRGERLIEGIIAITPEGKEIEFEFKQQLAYWDEFYEKNNIDWVEMPKQLKATTEEAVEMKRLIEKFGFDKMIIIPENLADTGVKYRNLRSCLTKRQDEPRLGKSFRLDGGFKNLKNKSNELRVIITREFQNLEDIKDNDTLAEIRKNVSVDKDPRIKEGRYLEGEGGLFEKYGIRGLDVATYLVWQKEYFESTGKHLDEKGRTWLTEQERPASGRVPGVGWRTNSFRLLFDAKAAKDHFLGLGCRPARTFEIEE